MIDDLLTFPQTGFWNYFGALNIVTEGLLIAVPIFIIWKLRVSLTRKVFIVFCFAVRIL